MAHEEGESSLSMSNQKFTHVFNPALVGEQIGERPGELRILWNDGRSFWHARRFLLRSNSNQSCLWRIVISAMIPQDSRSATVLRCAVFLVLLIHLYI
jgi:hypothetical protein